jgi:hypothetical protein
LRDDGFCWSEPEESPALFSAWARFLAGPAIVADDSEVELVMSEWRWSCAVVEIMADERQQLVGMMYSGCCGEEGQRVE